MARVGEHLHGAPERAQEREGHKGPPLPAWGSGVGEIDGGRAIKALPYQGGERTMDAVPKRKYIRLPEEAYRNPANVFSITIDALGRQRFFVRADFNDAVVEQLKKLARERRCPVKIYCLMPTHLHLLISPGAISLVRWVALFKQATQHRASRDGIEKLWQRSFFDHRVRSNEGEAETIEYIRTNPVRSGLVGHPDDWPWMGSVVW
jgi:putative transposase